MSIEKYSECWKGPVKRASKKQPSEYGTFAIPIWSPICWPINLETVGCPLFFLGLIPCPLFSFRCPKKRKFCIVLYALPKSAKKKKKDP